MLRGLSAPEIRPTKDIDFLGNTSNREDNIVSQMNNILDAGWDLIIVDEAYRLGGSSSQVARYKLGKIHRLPMMPCENGKSC